MEQAATKHQRCKWPHFQNEDKTFLYELAYCHHYCVDTMYYFAMTFISDWYFMNSSTPLLCEYVNDVEVLHLYQPSAEWVIPYNSNKINKE